MTRTVHCQKYDQELEGLAFPPFPGERGDKIFQSVSKKAWGEWLQQQTMLINEKQLNVIDPNTQTYLASQFEKFINNESLDKIEGYVPLDQK